MKGKILFLIKIHLLIAPAVFGYWFIYLLVWFGIGLPIETWSLWLLAILAGLSEWLFLKWVGRWEKDDK